MGEVPSILTPEELVLYTRLVIAVVGGAGVLGVVILSRLVCPDPSAHPKKEKVDTGEECKLHSQRLSRCHELRLHDGERPGWETCGRRGCLIVPQHNHEED